MNTVKNYLASMMVLLVTVNLAAGMISPELRQFTGASWWMFLILTPFAAAMAYAIRNE